MFPIDPKNDIWLPSGKERLHFDKTRIVFIEADDQYCYVNHLDDANYKLLDNKADYPKIVFASTTLVIQMCEMEKRMGNNFCRTHRTFLVNLGYVTHYHGGEGGRLFLFNGKEFGLSDGGRKDYFSKLDAKNNNSQNTNNNSPFQNGSSHTPNLIHTPKRIIHAPKMAIPQKNPYRK